MQRLGVRDVRPGLATVIVGDSYPAHAYERRVRRLATRLGCHYVQELLAADVEEADAVAAVGKLAADPRISGILILRPLPPQVSEATLYRVLDPGKDIEAVHPVNSGLLALRRPRFVPSTPAAVFHMLDRYLIESGRDPAQTYAASTLVVIGRSASVGTPAVLLGLERNATVLSCDEHSHRAGLLYDCTRRADILIVAAGVPGLVTGEHVKEGVIAIDVGINAVTDPVDGTLRLVGDLDFVSVAARAEAVSPVPGGVGPITDIWLLANTLRAAWLEGTPSRDGSLDDSVGIDRFGLRAPVPGGEPVSMATP
ncbi:bifunctional protein FolD 2 [Pseudonocardia asaccharolytica DSM 44247 = NBRC 16224]|uniref:Bifunctional protein FolD n=1 Tax=Pseudonocardia asaccharolytica DSM 44247 = NBRC 16224 TaxID=1123024 RepID=A0A511D5K4_9PSEU|nr:bifunctional protein FolD 2 [Pseudonocardia asaccharolytica DSM 44247 = NBRC 16224]